MAEPFAGLAQVWDHLQAQMPHHDQCGRRLQFGWGTNTPVAVCRPCDQVYAISVDDAAQLIANARARADGTAS